MIKIYKTIILPIVLYGCETWSLMLREGHRPRVFKNRMLRKIFWPKRDAVAGDRIMTKFVNCTPRQILLGCSNHKELDRHIWETGEVHTGFWWGNVKERNHVEDLGVDGRLIAKLIF
jgi:hypothetical protein